jgi:hypothetical protein
MSSQREVLKDAADVMTCGKLVAPGNCPPKCTPGPVLETPCRASDHHSYPLIPSRGTPAALFTSRRTFSSRVNLLSKSLTRALIGWTIRQNGKPVAGPPGAHAKGGLADAAEKKREREKRRIQVRVRVQGEAMDEGPESEGKASWGLQLFIYKS